MFQSICYEYLLHDEFYHMLKDIEKSRNRPHKGIYKGIEWEIRRPSRTYLCGYIYPKPEIGDRLTEEDYEKLQELSHGGLTCGIGFDCSHYGDYFGNIIYPPNPTDMDFYNSTLRRLPKDNYVEDILNGGLDYLEYILKKNFSNLGHRRLDYDNYLHPKDLPRLKRNNWDRENIGIHRDYDYVFQKIKDMIDYLEDFVDEKTNEEY